MNDEETVAMEAAVSNNLTPEDWKILGNSLVKKKEWENALHAYRSGLSSLKKSSYNSDLESALRLNIAFALLKLQRYQKVEEECDRILLISPTNSKAFYRRAKSREGLYFSPSNQIEKNHSTIERKKKKDLLKAAIHDLQKSLELINKIDQRKYSSSIGSNIDNNTCSSEANRSMRLPCQRSLDRLEKEYNCKWRNEQNDDELKKPNSDDKSVNKKKRESDRSDNLKGNNIQLVIASKSQQKQDILRLLLARQAILTATTVNVAAKHQNQKVLQGEALFLIEWNWFVKWCRFVDFFNTSVPTTNKNLSSTERATTVLDLFLPGATVPLIPRSDQFVDDDDMSDDDEVESPGLIDNTNLIAKPNNFCKVAIVNDAKKKSFTSLKMNLVRGYHYELLPREIYNALRSWYGEVSPSICRRVTQDYKILCHSPPSSCDEPLSRCNACRAPGASSKCKECMSVIYCNKFCQQSHWFYHRPYCKSRLADAISEEKSKLSISKEFLPPDSKGRVGLNNLGNTCFMNSALQSLSHAAPLTRYFLSNRFKSEINTSNSLGTGGKLALAYEIFLKDIWMKPGMKSISPMALKRAISTFAPRFAGCHQHDAQEFLAYVLDGLHEDLNKIIEAPYVAIPDVTDRQNMAVAAARAWDAHKRRNDSFILDTFYGQFQSTCVCPRCNKVSVSFDAFNHVSLEIPKNSLVWSNVTIPVLVHFYDFNRKPVRYGINLQQQSTIFDLKAAISKLVQIPAAKLVITDVHQSSICSLLDDNKNISTIQPNEDFIVAYEVTPYSTRNTLHMIVSQFILPGFDSSIDHNKNRCTSNNTTNGENSHNLNQIPIGLPFMTSIEADKSTCSDLWQLIWNFVRRMVEVTGETTENIEIKNEESDCVDILKCRALVLEEALTIHIIDPNGQPRYIFETAEEDKRTSVLPNTSRTLLSNVLGESFTENFLFLNLIWKPSIDPKRFIEYSDHSSLSEGVRCEQNDKNCILKEGVSLHQCFQSFSKPERLDTNNMWYCSNCKDHVQALKTMKLWKLPNILVVHFKRFEFKHALRRDKLCTFVDFPLTGLNMDSHCCKTETDFFDSNVPANYDLFAVVNHYGRMGFGHYTAFATSWDETGISNEWNVYDDSNVTAIDSTDIPSPAAYILFYRRRVFS